jgi:hypothetical protein
VLSVNYGLSGNRSSDPVVGSVFAVVARFTEGVSGRV